MRLDVNSLKFGQLSQAVVWWHCASVRAFDCSRWEPMSFAAGQIMTMPSLVSAIFWTWWEIYSHSTFHFISWKKVSLELKLRKNHLNICSFRSIDWLIGYCYFLDGEDGDGKDAQALRELKEFVMTGRISGGGGKSKSLEELIRAIKSYEMKDQALDFVVSHESGKIIPTIIASTLEEEIKHVSISIDLSWSWKRKGTKRSS